MPVEVVAADVRVKEGVGKRAIQRGQLVYCFEEADGNGEAFDRIALSPETKYRVEFQPSLLNDVVTVTAMRGDRSSTLIPYYAWDNRGSDEMKV
jgi:DUF1680 family protein